MRGGASARRRLQETVAVYTRKEDIREMEAALGVPVETEMTHEIGVCEYDMVKSSMRKGRAHDVTMFIRRLGSPGEIAVIRKPFFPPVVYRAPSGAADRGESLARGAVRESMEETGLDVELSRYVARINARFTSDGRVIEWISHVFEARHVEGEIGPIDTEEIEEARWATLEDIQGEIRQALLDTGWGLLVYRVALTDLTVRELGGVAT